MNVRYIVELTDGERVTLQQCLAGGKERARKRRWMRSLSSGWRMYCSPQDGSTLPDPVLQRRPAAGGL